MMMNEDNIQEQIDVLLLRKFFSLWEEQTAIWNAFAYAPRVSVLGIIGLSSILVPNRIAQIFKCTQESRFSQKRS